MSTEVDLNNVRFCRACLQEWKLDEFNNDECKMHDIFPDLVQKFLACTTIKAEPNDAFPQYLCDCCCDKLNKFHAFQIMCINSIQRYQEMLESFTQQTLQDNVINEGIKDSPAEGVDSKQSLHMVALFEEEIHNMMETEMNVKENPLNIITTRTRRCRRNTVPSPSKSIEQDEKSNDSYSGSNTSQQIAESFSSEDIAASECCASSRPTGKRTAKTKSPSGEPANPNRKTDKSRFSNVYRCDRCSKRFFVKHRLVAHKRVHDGLVPYPCTYEGCTRGFQRWHCLSEHIKQHEGTNRWFACQEIDCNRKYKHKATLDIHLRRFHKKGPELQSFVCEICGKVFKSAAILNDHRFTHKEKSELPFACNEPQCKYRFSNKAKLRVHLLRHAGIKKFECPHCGMRKTTRNELKIHINYHTLERTFPCRFCTQVCNSSGNLKVHVRTVHERAKDYACRYCDRSFAKPDTRKYHEMIHTGEKPHQCAECGKRFVQPAALRTHKKIHQKEQQTQKTSSSVQASTDKMIETVDETAEADVQFDFLTI